jgi:dTMP kinase
MGRVEGVYPHAVRHPFLSRLAGRFLAFEGGDGSGKSTQLRRFADLCRAAPPEGPGLVVCEVREPGGTPIGEKIRAVLLDRTNAGMSLRCEMLLYMASRAQLVEQRIAPALSRGEVVLADRFLASTYAYQGAAGGLPRADIDAVAPVACRGVLPHLNVVFDVDESTAGKRTGVAPGKDAPASLFADRMEDRDLEFRRKVRQSYLLQAKADPDRFLVIDARGEPDQVFARLLEGLARRFQ